MQLVFHAGVHFTEEERLMKCLLRNKEAFGPLGVAVPGPGKYRKLLRETMLAMRDAPAADGAREVLLDAILDDENAERVLMSNADFFGMPRGVVRKGLLYPSAAEKVSNIATIFHDDQIEIFLALRNPASFLPAIFHKSSEKDLADFMGGVDPRAVRWSDTLLRIREAAPEVTITVWCNEDAPLVWTEVIRAMAGLNHSDAVIGGHDLLGEIMSEDGRERFFKYIEEHPDLSEIQIRRVIVAFLDKFALDEVIEEELDMPGWSQQLVAEMTETYDEDVFAIARIPGVELISP